MGFSTHGSFSPALTCINRSSETTTVQELARTARRALAPKVATQVTGPTVTFTATDPVLVRAAVALTMASTSLGPIDRATVATTSWRADSEHYASWGAAAGPQRAQLPAGRAGSPAPSPLGASQGCIRWAAALILSSVAVSPIRTWSEPPAT